METKAPKISVLMPAYNAEKYIAEAIESILNQTLKDFEFIIVDDCSTDGTLKIIEKYASKDSRIKIIHNTTNLYISKAINAAIEIAKAEIMARMDADDIAMPTRLEKQYKLLMNNPDVAVTGANMQIIDEEGREVCIRKYFANDKDLREKIFRYSPFAHPVVMYRRNVVREFGCYTPAFSPSEDVNLWFRIGTKYKFANVPEVLLRYRFFSDSSSNKKIHQVEIKTLKMRWYAWRHQGYKPNFFDIIYNIGQALTMYLMPVKWRIKVFNFIRRYWY